MAQRTVFDWEGSGLESGCWNCRGVRRRGCSLRGIELQGIVECMRKLFFSSHIGSDDAHIRFSFPTKDLQSSGLTEEQASPMGKVCRLRNEASIGVIIFCSTLGSLRMLVKGHTSIHSPILTAYMPGTLLHNELSQYNVLLIH